jgi:hypothetical protein
MTRRLRTIQPHCGLTIERLVFIKFLLMGLLI